MNQGTGWQNWGNNNLQPQQENYWGSVNQNNLGTFGNQIAFNYNMTNQFQSQNKSNLNSFEKNTNWIMNQTGPQLKSKSSWKQHSGWGVRTQNPIQKSIPYSIPVAPFAQLYSTPVNLPTVQINNKLEQNVPYQIVSALDQSMVVQISQAKGNENKILLGKRNDKNNQKFKFYRENNGKLVIYNQISSPKQINYNDISNILILNIQNCSPTIGAPIIASTPNNNQFRSPNQLWQLVQNNDVKDSYFIQTFCGKCWDLCQWKTSQDTPIFQYDFNGGKNQIWIFKKI